MALKAGEKNSKIILPEFWAFFIPGFFEFRSHFLDFWRIFTGFSLDLAGFNTFLEHGDTMSQVSSIATYEMSMKTSKFWTYRKSYEIFLKASSKKRTPATDSTSTEPISSDSYRNNGKNSILDNFFWNF